MRYVSDLPHDVTVIEHQEIPMADGTRLSARIWIPESARDRPVPALLEYIPYRKRDLTRDRDEIHAPYLAGHGFAFARVDIRGCGDSEGFITDEYSEAELADGVDVIQWLADQPWCSGSVGMMGISWGGIVALAIAARRPPALRALVAVCGSTDTYEENMHYQGGCMLTDNLSEATTMFAFQSLPPDPQIVGEKWRAMWRERLEHCEPWILPWLEHQRRDEYWRRTSVEDLSAIQCPVMAVSGWADGFTNSVFRLVERLEVPRQGLIGPWSHMYPHTGEPGPAIGFLQEVRRWFGQWLRDEDNGVTSEPSLTVWMQDSMPPQFRAYAERLGRWVAEPSWPSPHVDARRIPFGDGRELRLDGTRPEHAEPRDIDSPLTLGLYAGKWCSYAATPDLPGDQREEDGGALVFESEPLREPLEALGMPQVELTLSADRPLAQVAVRLNDVFPDGRVSRVTYGLKNLTHRESHSDPKPIIPGEKMRVRVGLNGFGQRFAKGHRLRVSISTSYWPLVWPAPEHATVTLYPEECALILPERTPHDLAPPDFDAPEGTEPSAVRWLHEPKRNWLVERDLGADTAALDVVRHDDHFVVEPIDLEVEKRTRERYSSRAHDFDSIRGETRTERRFVRGSHRVHIETRTLLTATPRHFRVHATIDAHEGEERVWSRSWTEQIERDLL